MNKEDKSKKGKTIGVIVGMIFFALAYYGT
jgi:hypothetical protein